MRTIPYLLLTMAAAALAQGAAAGTWTAAATAARDAVVISNGTAADGRDVSCRWKALRNGTPVAMGAFPVSGMKPGRALTNAVPQIVRTVGAAGGEMSLRITFSRLAENADGERTKTSFATCQIDFPDRNPETLALDLGGPKPEGTDEVVLRTDGQTYAFDRRTGLLAQMSSGGFFGRTWLAGPVAPAFDVPRRPETLWTVAPTNGADGTSCSSAVRWHAADGSNDVDVVTRWTVRNDGLALVACELRAADPDAPYAGPFGLRFAFRDEALLQYFGLGRGPGDSAAAGDMLGQWTVEPGESAVRGTLRGVRALAVDPGARHLSFVATGRPLDVDYELGAKPAVVVRSPGADTNGVTRLAFALWPAKRLAPVRVPSAALPPAVERGVAAEGTLPFAKFHELPRSVVAKGLLVRTAKSAKGRVKGFTFETSEDGRLWTRVFEGELADRTGWQQADFKEAAKMRWWRFEAVNAQSGAREASVAEIKVITE